MVTVLCVCARGETREENALLYPGAGQPTVCLQPGEWRRLLKPLRVEASRVVDSKNHNSTLNRRDGRQGCQLRSRPIACEQVPREWLFPDRGGRWGVGFRRLALPTIDSAVWGNGLVRPPLALEPSHLSPPHHGRANPRSVRQHMGTAGTAIGRRDGSRKSTLA